MMVQPRPAASWGYLPERCCKGGAVVEPGKQLNTTQVALWLILSCPTPLPPTPAGWGIELGWWWQGVAGVRSVC